MTTGSGARLLVRDLAQLVTPAGREAPLRGEALGTVEVVVEFHPSTTLAECGSRKVLARYCEERVAAGLGRALSGRRRAPRGRRPPADTVTAAPGSPQMPLTT